MDWTDPCIVDALWHRLLRLDQLAAWADRGFVSPLSAWFCVAGVCKGFYVPARVLFERLDRPFLSRAPLRHAQRAVMGELAFRLFLVELRANAAAQGVQLVLAGGFAAWGLERHVDTCNGFDALPRSSRATTIAPAYPLREFWVPGELDVYFATADEDKMLEVAHAPFRRFAKRMTAAARYLCIRTAVRTEPATEPPLSKELPTAERHAFCCQRDAAPQAAPVSCRWTLLTSLAEELFVPQGVSLWSCPDPSDLPFSLFFSHMCVELRVGEGMEYVFCCDETTFYDLTHRLLRVRCRGRNAGFYTALLHRYAAAGFTFGGDNFYGGEPLARAVRRTGVCAPRAPLLSVTA